MFQKGICFLLSSSVFDKQPCAEEKGIVKIADTIVLDESLLGEKIEDTVLEMIDYLYTISDKGISQKDLAQQKETLFLFGKTVAKIL